MQHCPSGEYLRGSFARRRDCKLNWFLQNYSLVPAAAAIASALTAFKEYSLEGCGWSPRETSCLILQKHWIELILSQRLREQIDLASLLCDAEWWAAWFTEGPKIWDRSTLDTELLFLVQIYKCVLNNKLCNEIDGNGMIFRLQGLNPERSHCRNKAWKPSIRDLEVLGRVILHRTVCVCVGGVFSRSQLCHTKSCPRAGQKAQRDGLKLAHHTETSEHWGIRSWNHKPYNSPCS